MKSTGMPQYAFLKPATRRLKRAFEIAQSKGLPEAKNLYKGSTKGFAALFGKSNCMAITAGKPPKLIVEPIP